MAGCAPPEPLQVDIEDAALVLPGHTAPDGTVIRVAVRLVNQGEAATHVFTDLLQIVGKSGSRGTVRELLERYRLQLAQAGSDAQRRSVESAFARQGVGPEVRRALAPPQIEVLPGQDSRHVLPFLLKGTAVDADYEMDMAYHDDASDRIVRLRLPVRIHEP